MTDKINKLTESINTDSIKTIGEYSFNIDDIIGKGAFANVYKGTLLNDPSKVFAIKEIDHYRLTEKAREALFKEIEIHQQIDNPAIVRLYNVKRTENHYYLILEYCEGKDLHNYLRTKKLLSE